MDVQVDGMLPAEMGGGETMPQHLLPSARANLLLPSPLAASGMGSTVGFVTGFFRFGDLLACAPSI